MKSILLLFLTVVSWAVMLSMALKPATPIASHPCTYFEARQLIVEAKMLQQFVRHELEASDAQEDDDDTADRMPLVIQ